MSFLAKLQQLKQTTKINEPNHSANQNKAKSLQSEEKLLPKDYVREVDPAIQRLKEARRLKQGISSTSTKPAAKARHKASSPKDEAPIYKKKPGVNTTSGKYPVVVPKREPIKKLSFDELMKRAEQKSREGPKEDKKPLPKKLGFDKAAKPKAATKDAKPVKEPKSKVMVKSFNRFAQPNEKLAKKLKLKEKKQIMARHGDQHYDSENDEDLSDFIEDDDLDECEQGSKSQPYDRDEIWSIFNKGSKRKYFDSDDDDDMEANEMEIFEEEERATKMAKLEDKREQAWLKEHEKRKKKLKKSHS
ncbi:Spt2p [Kluyveromyces lactis]|uniref:KLLA0F14487p n=1 Tax=Kluyveromyces lactis (strain ATCC 8585 / CBS 2359 / DSM 70799 / NBRC 1267 / NRRL Y-1140 / WM37) TaxID=284590 RepID=Q6CK08_KLULA|nr:uncharacterized protein KLLA0_F14487g [Kluyveromyces lactis]CAG98439.1 KLLA0F14487p [Kluyveromyces lactis]|eukprot:XP_455731.1 uncharacterized protein KLLA0_F14487g [Kluyveromyces lactis]